MKITDVINQFRSVIPKYTDVFSNVLTIDSINAVSGTATIITTSAHGLTTGDNIVLKDVVSQTPLDTMTQDGLVFTITTTIDHDLTYGWPEHETVTLNGFDESEWNASFTLLSVPNRRTFTIRSTNTIPSAMTFPLPFPWVWETLAGTENLLENRIDGVNGRYSVTVIDSTTITIAGDFNDGEYLNGTISTDHRISGAVTEERAIELYTAQSLSDYWMFIVMNDASVSKDRQAYSDATATKATGNDMRMKLVDNFSAFIIVNVTQDITAIDALDACRHDLLLPILRSVHGAVFTSGTTYSNDFKCILIGHSVFGYDKAVFVYRYDFELTMELTDDDTVLPDYTSAFRNIDYYQDVGGDDTDQMTILPINLDEEPL